MVERREVAEGHPDGFPLRIVLEGVGPLIGTLQTIDDLVFDLETDPGPQSGTGPDRLPGAKQRKLLKTAAEFAGYIRADAGSIPNYGERHRAGEIISTSFVEPAVNQVVSKRMVKEQQQGPQRRPRRRLPPLVTGLHPPGLIRSPIAA